jgi:hypothetical protein
VSFSILERRDEWVNQRREHVADLERRAAEAEAELKRLYDAIENGIIDVIRIRGLRSELLRTLTAASGVEAAVLGVCAFEPKWRARRDSNPRPPDSKSGALSS